MAREHILETDILIIGGGIAGCFAANRAREIGVEVLLVEARRSGLCGMSSFGFHGLRVHHPEDDLDIDLKGTVVESEFMPEQPIVKTIIKETWDRYLDLLEFGVRFRGERPGDTKWTKVVTSLPWQKQRHAHFEPMASHNHLLKVHAAALRKGAKTVDRVMVTDLLSSDGKVCGAVGFDTINGDFYRFQAKAVIIATGTFQGGAGEGPTPQLTGDGIAMALRAGVGLRGMEFGKGEMLCMSPSLRVGVGRDDHVMIVNSQGEEIMEQYELGRRMPDRRYAGPPWRIVLRAVLRECREGRGPCFIRDKNNQGQCELEIGYGQPQGGGIRINVDGETNMQGIFGAGASTDFWGVTQYTIPTTISGSITSGYRAGESAAKYALDQKGGMETNHDQVSLFKKEIYSPLDRAEGITADEIRRKARDAWLNLDLRNKENLNKACDEYKEFEKDFHDARSVDSHDLVKLHKMKNYNLCAQAVANSALIREESRMDHYREDYPLTDNKKWLKWVLTRMEEDGIQTSLEDIPIEQYECRPEETVYDLLAPREGGV